MRRKKSICKICVENAHQRNYNGFQIFSYARSLLKVCIEGKIMHFLNFPYARSVLWKCTMTQKEYVLGLLQLTLACVYMFSIFLMRVESLFTTTKALSSSFSTLSKDLLLVLLCKMTWSCCNASFATVFRDVVVVVVLYPAANTRKSSLCVVIAFNNSTILK